MTVCQCFLGTRDIVADYRDDRLGEEEGVFFLFFFKT